MLRKFRGCILKGTLNDMFEAREIVLSINLCVRFYRVPFSFFLLFFLWSECSLAYERHTLLSFFATHILS